MKQILLSSSLLIPLLLSGCVSENKYNEAIKNLSESNAKASQLEKELDELNNGAEKLLKEAQQYAQNKDLTKLKQTLDLLTQKHPTAPELDQVKQLVSTLDAFMKQEEEAKVAAAKKAEEEKTAKAKKEQEEKDKAEKERKETEAKRMAEATSKMRKVYDEVKDITWFYDQSTPKFIDTNSFHLYFGQKKDQKPTLRFKIQFAGEDWLFIDKYIFKVDDKTFEISGVHSEVQRDNKSKVWEWYDVLTTKSNYEIVKSVIASKKTILRYEGKQHYYDRTITDAEKQALQNVLDAFVASGGELKY